MGHTPSNWRVSYVKHGFLGDDMRKKASIPVVETGFHGEGKRPPRVKPFVESITTNSIRKNDVFVTAYRDFRPHKNLHA